MFRENSRYRAVSTLQVHTPEGREVTAVALRRIPLPGGADHGVKEGDRLDLLADRLLHDATAFWRIADANTELEARRLEAPAGRVITVPER